MKIIDEMKDKKQRQKEANEWRKLKLKCES